MERLLTLFTILLLAFGASAQNSRAQNRMLDQALLLFDAEEYRQAMIIYKKLYPMDTSYTEVVFNLAICYLQEGVHGEKAQRLLEQAVRQEHTEAHYQLASLYHKQHRFDEEVSLLKKYKELYYREHDDQETDRKIEVALNAKRILARPNEWPIKNLGPRVNSKAQDYVPFATADGQELYFTSRRSSSKGGLKDSDGNYMEDIYVCSRRNGEWSMPKNVGVPLNTITHDATVGLKPNGNAMLIYRTSRDLVSGDLYLTEHKNGKWAEPKMLGPQINSNYQEASACFTGDENIFYFSSNRPGGYGGRDLYRVKRLPTGEWSKPLNLGPMINTPYDEDAPFVHSDGVTLYFASTGHSSIGGFDVFSAKLIGQDEWTVPENLGAPVNTVNDDIYFSLSADGTVGYFSSERKGGFGKQDIYQVTFPDPDMQYAIVRGTVTTIEEVPLKAHITLYNKFGEIHGEYTSNARHGGFIMVVDPGVTYNMVVRKDGFLEASTPVRHLPANKEIELPVQIKLVSSKEQFTNNE